MVNICEFENLLFIQRENETHHSDYNDEYTVYDMIIHGDTEKLKQQKFNLDSEDKGQLSDDPVRNIRYHFIIAVSIITRMCIENRMDKEIAFSLSDMYIKKCDNCNEISGIKQLHNDMIIDFANRMHKLTKNGLYSHYIIKAFEFINTHLNTKITINSIAQATNISPNYLSAIFKKETGVLLSEYIKTAKMHEAKRMLRFTEYTESDISQYLAFSSCSHFISMFKDKTGVTPKVYRKNNFRKNFKGE